jgi:serine/threonine protein kinase
MPTIDGDTTLVTPVEPGTDRLPATLGGNSVLRQSLDSLQARLAVPSRFEVIDEIGRGGMGIVYKVRDIETCEIVALKILKPEIAGDPTMRESLRKEVCLARKVTHKNVCRIHEFARSETTACISMEYVDGESLLSKLNRRGTLSAVDAVEIGMQICAGLREAHAQGIIHRDLKPANIVIARDKTVKIMDFGVARHTQDSAPTTETLAGTPAYMSPEQLEMKAVSGCTDIYSLGLILYEMVAGEPAFHGDSAIALALKQLREEAPRPSAIAPAIPAKLDAAILRCLEKDPEKRFASVEELSAALQKSVGLDPVSTHKVIDFKPAKAVVKTAGRAAWADLYLLGKNLKAAGIHLRRNVGPQFVRWVKDLRDRDWRSQPVRKVHATALTAAVLLSAAAAFTIVTHAHNRTAGQASQNAASSQAVSAASDQPPVAQPTSPFDAKEFEFSSVVPSDDDTAVLASAVVPVPTSAKISHATTIPRKPKLSPTNPALSSSAQASADIPTENSETDQSSIVAEIPVDGRKDIAAPLLALQPAAPVESLTNASQTVAGVAATYLEVGTFSDARWADDATKKLSDLGFPAFSVHKTVLWMQSYHVEVGPYQNAFELDAAQKQLSANGFKSRPVK